MFFHQAKAISPVLFEEQFQKPEDTPTVQLFANEPKYGEYIPRNILRRMGKATRMGVGTALSLIDNTTKIDGIVIGTGLGGMEDCIKFLNQIVEFEEGTLTPTNFVQSTPNALAGVLGLMLKNTCYNMTHVGRGGAFEAALLDTFLSINEGSDDQFLLGSTEEISDYNFNIDKLDGLFKDKPIQPDQLLNSETEGSICGEGSTMYLVSKEKGNAPLEMVDIYHRTSDKKSEVLEWFDYVQSKIGDAPVSDMVLGKNGDVRNDFYYDTFSDLYKSNKLSFKHVTGDYPSATSFALYLAFRLASEQNLPDYFYLSKENENIEDILVYNHYRGEEHCILHLRKH